MVLRLLRDEGPLSRADLARRSGLAKATVGTIVSRLQDLGAVRAGEQVPGARGRPGTRLELDGRRYVGVGIEVNVDYTSVTVIDLAGRPIHAERHPVTRPAPPDVADLVADVLAPLAAAHRAVLGVTLAVPGLIDRARGVVEQAPNLGWSEVDLAAAVRPRLPAGAALAVDNDANCAVRAEIRHGVAAGAADVVYLTGTVGLGAGLSVAGETVRGSRGLAGEIGHQFSGDPSRRCACGRSGCWEAVLGLRALVADLGVPLRAGEDPVAYAARVAGAPGVGTRLSGFGARLGDLVTALALVLDPALVVLGGSFVPLAPHLLPAVRERLAASFTGAGCEVRASGLGLGAASLGAAVDAWDDVFAGRRDL